MADRHAVKTRSVRLPGDLPEWLAAEAAATGVSEHGLIVAAVREMRERREAARGTSPGEPLACGDTTR